MSETRHMAIGDNYAHVEIRRGYSIDENAVDILEKWRQSKEEKLFTIKDIQAEAKKRNVWVDAFVLSKTVNEGIRTGEIYTRSGYGKGRLDFVYGFTKHLPPGVKPPTLRDRRRQASGQALQVRMTYIEAIDALEHIVKAVRATYGKR